MPIRQPIVSVLGHVDHGKTSLLDHIRGTTVAKKEAGGITQHIGATEVPLQTIYSICGPLIKGKEFTVPGLLFIDTPGHHSFTTMRARGNALADIAVLVVDINEGLKPQTIEALNLLKRFKTPFVIAANKIDLIDGWRSQRKMSFAHSSRMQDEAVTQALDSALYTISGRLSELDLSAERYDRIADFQRNIAMIPVSAKTGEGIPDLLLVLIGLAQRFLEAQLTQEEGRAEGTVLEIKEERGLGPTMDVIIFKGTVRKGDTIVIGGAEKPIVTKVKALLKPKPLDEIRAPKEKFKNVGSVTAAAGIKICAQDITGAMAGAPLKVAGKDVDDINATISEIERESRLEVETTEDGLIVKADAVGSLEALAYECKQAEIKVKKAEVGDISRRDVVEATTVTSPLHRIILGFNVRILPDARDEIEKNALPVLQNDVIYRLIEDYNGWVEKKKSELDSARRKEVTYPVKFKLLPGCVFRVSRPAIVGVRVLAGRLRPNVGVLRADGRVVGRIKSIQSESKSLDEALTGSEVAIAIDDATVGRQIDAGDILYGDIHEDDVKKLLDYDLNFEEKETLEKVCEIKRKEKPFWGM